MISLSDIDSAELTAQTSLRPLCCCCWPAASLSRHIYTHNPVHNFSIAKGFKLICPVCNECRSRNIFGSLRSAFNIHLKISRFENFLIFQTRNVNVMWISLVFNIQCFSRQVPNNNCSVSKGKELHYPLAPAHHVSLITPTRISLYHHALFHTQCLVTSFLFLLSCMHQVMAHTLHGAWLISIIHVYGSCVHTYCCCVCTLHNYQQRLHPPLFTLPCHY